MVFFIEMAYFKILFFRRSESDGMEMGGLVGAVICWLILVCKYIRNGRRNIYQALGKVVSEIIFKKMHKKF